MLFQSKFGHLKTLNDFDFLEKKGSLKFGSDTMEFFLNRTELSGNGANH